MLLFYFKRVNLNFEPTNPKKLVQVCALFSWLAMFTTVAEAKSGQVLMLNNTGSVCSVLCAAGRRGPLWSGVDWSPALTLSLHEVKG